MRLHRVAMLGLAGALTLGCQDTNDPTEVDPSFAKGGKPGSGAVASVEVTPATTEIVVGGTAQLTAVAKDRNGKVIPDVAFTWSSSDDAVASVGTETGLVTGVAVGGPVTITASTGGKRPKAGQGTVTVLAPVTPMISTTSRHSCAIDRAGSLYCWGSNADGQLGLGYQSTYETTPQRAGGTGKYRAVAAGSFHTCVLTLDGDALCWGENTWGQLGNGSVGPAGGPPVLTPEPVTGGHKFTAIAAATYHSCGLTSEGKIYCWGGNREGALGTGWRSEYESTPQQVSGELQFTQVVANRDHTCALVNDGRAFCWGHNDYGQLGYRDGTDLGAASPQLVLGGYLYSELSADGIHNCGVTRGGSVMCWGNNVFGQLGNGLSSTDGEYNRPLPVAVVDLTDAVHVAAGGSHTCAVRAGGAGVCWGRNDKGQLGTGTVTTGDYPWSVPAPVAITGSLNLGGAASGSGHTCALTMLDAVYCWGANADGNLGDGSTTDRAAPVFIMNLGL